MAHLSLFQLNTLLKKTFEQHLESSYWVVAEIGELRLNQNGHCYMELVEKEGNFVSAKIRANIWAYTYRTISGSFESVTNTPLQPGLKVLMNVSVQLHEVYGLSLNVKDIDPNFTLGERARKRQEIIQKLIDDGVFEMNKALQLPQVPQRIAIISSKSAAGYGDFTDHLETNIDGYHLNTTLYAASMQGDQAPNSIIKSLKNIHDQIENYDLVVIIRGGGSQLDLDCFDDYELASHVAQFPIPIITGIGHERDETIVDLVGHTKMKTPTAVADFLLNGLSQFESLLNEQFARIHDLVRVQLAESQNRLSLSTSNLSFKIKHHLQETWFQLNRTSDALQYTASSALSKPIEKLDRIQELFISKSSDFFVQQNQRLSNFERQFSLIEPSAILKRGFSISKVNGRLISQVDLKEGDEIVTIHSNGEAKSIVNNLSND